jgi:hypothetical protein
MSNPLNTLMSQLKSLGYLPPGTAPAPGLTTPATGRSLLQKIGVIATIIVLVIAVLLVVHYTIRPIFKFSPDNGGIIPVPFAKTGATAYWKTPRELVPLTDKKTVISEIPYNYSFAADIVLIDPIRANDSYRPILIRGPSPSQMPAVVSGNSLHAGLGDVNIALVLEKNTNDLRVTTTLNTPTRSKENIIVRNIPIGTPFTVGVILASNYMEVYMNGKLYETKTFVANPGEFVSAILPPAQENADIFRIRNLRIWPRVVSPNIMRELPAPSLSDFEGLPKRHVILSTCS